MTWPPRPAPGSRLPGAADHRGHRVRRPDRHRADRAAEHRRAPGHPAGPPACPRHAGERYWRPEDPGAELLSGVDAVIHLAGASIAGRFTPGPQAGDPRQPDHPDPPPGRARRGHRHGRSPRPAGVRHRVGHRDLRPGPRRRGADRDQRPRRRVPGRRGRRLGGRHRPRPPGRASGPSRSAPASCRTPRGGMLHLLLPAVRGRPRRPAGRRPAVAGLDRPGRPAGHLPAGGHRPGPVRAGQRGRPRPGAQRRVHRHAGPRAAPARRCCRYRRSVRGCCSVARAPARSPRPASTSARSG